MTQCKASREIAGCESRARAIALEKSWEEVATEDVFDGKLAGGAAAQVRRRLWFQLAGAAGQQLGWIRFVEVFPTHGRWWTNLVTQLVKGAVMGLPDNQVKLVGAPTAALWAPVEHCWAERCFLEMRSAVAGDASTRDSQGDLARVNHAD